MRKWKVKVFRRTEALESREVEVEAPTADEAAKEAEAEAKRCTAWFKVSPPSVVYGVPSVEEVRPKPLRKFRVKVCQDAEQVWAATVEVEAVDEDDAQIQAENFAPSDLSFDPDGDAKLDGYLYADSVEDLGPVAEVASDKEAGACG